MKAARKEKGAAPRWRLPAVLGGVAAAVALLTWIGQGKGLGTLLARLVYLLALAAVGYALRPGGLLHKETLEKITEKGWLIFGAVFTAAALVIGVLMTSSPALIDNSNSWRNQYEEMAESILEGRLSIENGHDMPQVLLEMDNPYDRIAREDLGLQAEDYGWDHAFYNGHYYMYFGVVPCLLLFLPYRMVMGEALPTTYGTIVLTLLIALAFFVLIFKLARKYCRQMSWGTYLALSCGLTAAGAWFIMKYPPLYCTAIAGGICCAMWGFIWLFQALVLDEEAGYRGYWRHLILGASCSALIFGCRPSIGLFCITYIPMGLCYASRHKKDPAHVAKTVLAFAIPFVVVAAGLMAYNYARFDNPFEFGQTYQLTSTDQSRYMSEFFKIDPVRTLGEMLNYLIYYTPLSGEFPYVHEDGVVLLFPILALGVTLFRGKSFDKLKRARVEKTVVGMAAALAAVMIIDHMWSPWLERRYAMDFSFILCILAAMAVCFLLSGEKDERLVDKTNLRVTWLGVYTLFIFGLLFLEQGVYSFSWCCPDKLAAIRDLVLLR